MGYNRSPLAFDDIREAFERALASPKGIRIPCVDRGAAFILRSRFNYYRKLNRAENKEVYDLGHPMYGKSPYDRLVCRIPPATATDAHVLYLEPRSADALGIEEIE